MLAVQPRTIEREGCPLHYWSAGEAGAPVVLLIHGAGLDHRLWDPNVAAIAARHRVIACDVRGHGRSRPMGAPFTVERVLDDLFAILDAEGAREAVLVGQSMGGNLAQAAVRQRPERVRALALVDCACNFGEGFGQPSPDPSRKREGSRAMHLSRIAMKTGGPRIRVGS